MKSFSNEKTDGKSSINNNGNQGKNVQQFVDNRPEAIAQRKMQEGIKSKETAQLKEKEKTAQLKEKEKTAQLKGGGKENKTGLPDNLKSGVEQLSGYSMDDVKVHYNSEKPEELNALAYAQGNQIHLGPGQEEHLNHEAWHVAQQKSGEVKETTQLKGGTPVNDDDALEKEADIMGEKAAELKAPELTAPMEKPEEIKEEPAQMKEEEEPTQMKEEKEPAQMKEGMEKKEILPLDEEAALPKELKTPEAIAPVEKPEELKEGPAQLKSTEESVLQKVDGPDRSRRPEGEDPISKLDSSLQPGSTAERELLRPVLNQISESKWSAAAGAFMTAPTRTELTSKTLLEVINSGLAPEMWGPSLEQTMARRESDKMDPASIKYKKAEEAFGPALVKKHLDLFSSGAHAFITKWAYERIIGEVADARFKGWGIEGDSNFVAPLGEAEASLLAAGKNAASDPKAGIGSLEQEFGIKPGTWSNDENQIFRFIIKDSNLLSQLKLPVGLEFQAYKDEWVFGGKTMGGANEAIIASMSRALFKENIKAGKIEIRKVTFQLGSKGYKEDPVSI